MGVASAGLRVVCGPEDVGVMVVDEAAAGDGVAGSAGAVGVVATTMYVATAAAASAVPTKM
ncbi:hypothetical protein [Mycolicibacter sinensis]|uniref:Uncharacterized protein n=1 Tax=Mycolicibacter sinensis (strain JDM601) TaxID=875328 RepID=A0A1A3TLU6_MYCSD|nr:hypothetical protein [Mycolicibacter sinensis]OBK83648.1 hypothetical protein A5648_11570 [Mycolicibacter sinensis]